MSKNYKIGNISIDAHQYFISILSKFSVLIYYKKIKPSDEKIMPLNGLITYEHICIAHGHQKRYFMCCSMVYFLHFTIELE